MRIFPKLTATMENKIGEVKTSINTLSDDIRSLKTSISSLDEKQKELSEFCDNLQQENRRLSDETWELRQQLLSTVYHTNLRRISKDCFAWRTDV